MGLFDFYDDFISADFDYDLRPKIVDFTRCITVASDESEGGGLFANTLFAISGGWIVAVRKQINSLQLTRSGLLYQT